MKEEDTGEFIRWFSDIDKDSVKVAGGKGANLAEIYNLKLPVPAGFVVTTQGFDHFLTYTEIEHKIKEIIDSVDVDDTSDLEKKSIQIQKLIEEQEMPKDLKDVIIESYNLLDDNMGMLRDSADKAPEAMKILKRSIEPSFVAVRSSSTAEDLGEASFAGQQESYVNVKGNANLIEAVKKVFASLYTARAVYYRKKKGFGKVDISIAVIVQKMVDSDKSGVIFSKNPVDYSDDIIIEAVCGLGDGIVSGSIKPDRYVVDRNFEIKKTTILEKKVAFVRDSGGDFKTVPLTASMSSRQVLETVEIKKLAQFALKLEEHYGKPQDIEFAISGHEIFLLQTRPITTLENKKYRDKSKIEGKQILTGLAASPGVSSGTVKIVRSLDDLSKIAKGDVLVTEMTNPDMVVAMQRANAIVTDEGGMTAHAAIISRELGIPCVVGTEMATKSLEDGQEITVDGFEGIVYEGKVGENVSKEVLPVVPTKTKIKVIVDIPNSAERAAKSGIKAIGLTRLEGIIASSKKHPLWYLKNSKLKDYENLLFEGLDKIAKHFDEIWVRTSDLRTDEFSSLEGSPKKEENPMLGFHGVRFSLKYPEIFKAELNAIKRISEKGKEVGIMVPQVIYVEEVKKVKEILNEMKFLEAKVGIMVETPAAVIKIKEICDEGIDFVSIGTNDLTQYTFAIDRGNEEVQYLYDDLNPAIFAQIRKVIKVCESYNVESSICGQAGSKKEMVEFLVNEGIKSISVNADMAHEISLLVQEMEGNKKVEGDVSVKSVRKEDHEERKSEKKNSEDEMGKRETKGYYQPSTKETEDGGIFSDKRGEFFFGIPLAESEGRYEKELAEKSGEENKNELSELARFFGIE